MEGKKKKENGEKNLLRGRLKMSFYWRFSEFASPRKPTNPQEGQLIEFIVF